ncbi:hypothetical protein B0H17DRAFT_1198335 [Mycena rosella]|uniref:BTB domain-containing protein n=1 Tax=Mycena rosella TaxID=1033263 RepID=A0AAD7DP05_MYCRO|nr:hypothetical protein B0H17DRAFT_1198335 [Mycena rosella]
MSAAKPTIAAPPFDGPEGDLIIESNDNVHFYVYKIILSLASPVFNDIFTSAQPPEPTNPNDHPPYPVIPVSEGSETAYQLLSWCDPRCTPTLGSTEDILMMLEVADKYCMDRMMKQGAHILMLSTSYIEKEPMKVFAIAVRYRLKDVAKLAAKHTLRLTWEDQVDDDTPELKHISAIALRQLQAYQLACKRALTSLLAGNLSWLDAWAYPHRSSLRTFSACSSRSSSQRDYWRCWLIQYVDLLKEELYKRPSTTTIVPNLLVPLMSTVGSKACSKCGLGKYKYLVQFNELLVKEVDRLVSEVPFELDC